MRRLGIAIFILLLAMAWVPTEQKAFAQNAERYAVRHLPYDLRVDYTEINFDKTLRAKFVVYQRNDAQKISDLVFYLVDKEKKPIAKITNIEHKGDYANCPFQGETYACMNFEGDPIPYPANAIGIAVYAASDDKLQHALGVDQIWESVPYRGSHTAQKAVFKDENPYRNEIKGTLTWKPAPDESRLTGYEVYMEFDLNSNYFIYVGTVPKGASSYNLKIPETVYPEYDQLLSFNIYSKSLYGGLSPFYAYTEQEDVDSAGVRANPAAASYADPDVEVPVPASVKPIPAPKAPTGKPPIRVFVQGEAVDFQTAPYLDRGNTLVPFRPIFEKLGLAIEWDAKSRKITGSKDNLTIDLTVDQRQAKVNGKTATLAVAPIIKNGSTFVPLRFISEATGLQTIWDGNLPAVYIYDGSTEGKLYYPDGTLRYEGQLKDGKMNGKGKLYREDGTLWYDAEFVDNEVTGLGTIHFGRSAVLGMPGEDIMIGEFRDGLPHGHSRYYYGDGSLAYDGEFEDGERTTGKQYDHGVLVYDGQWKNLMYEGKGKYYKDGFLSYEGEFSENARHGYGKTYNKAGYVSSEGEHRNGVLEGYGKTYYPNGKVQFEGEFQEGVKWGGGKAYYPNGKLEFDGVYEYGHMRTGTYYFPDGRYYTGEFANDSPRGKGKWFSADGKLILEGNFDGGIPPANEKDRIYGLQ
ncbi:stalk domain-containing protein [Cohnella caldifontis]|uniref:stalk domain-containing protein n=1 Tax=Cohnella caldifontis TaxID=3027471 RepID=UPI0023EC3078|nr:stalk domain-containing protein [Cohnella sp. YIM B05605]